MQFIDQANIILKAGKGGNGIVSFRSTLLINEFEGLNGEKPNFKNSKIQINSVREDFSFS